MRSSGERIMAAGFRRGLYGVALTFVVGLMLIHINTLSSQLRELQHEVAAKRVPAIENDDVRYAEITSELTAVEVFTSTP